MNGASNAQWSGLYSLHWPCSWQVISSLQFTVPTTCPWVWFVKNGGKIHAAYTVEQFNAFNSDLGLKNYLKYPPAMRNVS